MERPFNQQVEAWHTRDVESTLAALKTNRGGLSSDEASARLAVVGDNQLPSVPSPPWWLIGLRQFRNPLIYILMVAAIFSLAIGEVADAGFIAGVLVLNALIGGVQEWRADRSTRALQRLMRVRATALRNGQACEIDAERLVPGDIVLLQSGDRVPADLRLVGGYGFEVDESLLTGESTSVRKDPAWVGRVETPLADRLNTVFAGSVVARGRGTGVVVATGASTQVGGLALDVMRTPSGKPPLLVRLERFTKVVGVATLIAAALVVVLGVLTNKQDIPTMVIFGIALAVSAIPEGLPVAITVALAVATTRMAKRGVIVRKLGAVEGLGSCTQIASDKTGTLTCNEMTVRRVYLADGRQGWVTGEGFAPDGEARLNDQRVVLGQDARLDDLIRAGALCNEADLYRQDGTWAWRGDGTEVALLTLALKLGLTREQALDLCPQVNQIPFEAEHQFSASYHRVDGRTDVYVKGSPERVLQMCRGATASAVIDEAREMAEVMASDGCRVLGLAASNLAEELDPAQVPPTPTALALLGLVGMIDPLRPGVQQSIEVCRRAGITVSMVTGDHPTTALAIGSELGLVAEGDRALSGPDIEATPDERLERMASEVRVFARVSPHQKLRIIEACQRAGHFVAVTGDGVNDAPALRQANIGVAMGLSGTDVAREAADIVISDDNFVTLVSGVEEGRVAYSNIRNVIYLLVSTGAAEVVLVMFAVVFGTPLPLLPVQLLWLNLVTNGIQDKALVFEPAEGDELRRAPRSPREPVFNRLMIERTIVAALVTGGVAFAAFFWMIQRGWAEETARNALLLLMVFFESVQIGNCRSETRSAFSLSPLRSPILLTGAIGALLVHLAAMLLPFMRELLGTGPVSAKTALTLFGLSLSVLIVIELHKWTWARRRRRDEPADLNRS